ncbi:MAG TPA: phosphatase PAP2 family protein [Bryobacteraceae bacterium]
MNTGYQQGFIDHPGPPADWMALQGANRETAWRDWVASILQTLNQVLWPSWDAAKREWPPDTYDQMKRLTAADLAILIDMQEDPRRRFNQPIRTPVSAPVTATHKEFFQKEDEEDGNTNIGTFHSQYDTTLPPDRVAEIPTLMLTGFSTKCLNTSDQLKRYLQRPRAYQMALLFGLQDYQNEAAITALSPSMVSGHCLEGLIAAGAVFDSWITRGLNISRESKIAMQQYAADIGDRRVMAGVHYPGDSLASWIVVMSQAMQLYKNGLEVKRHLWSAIRDRSFIYEKIRSFEPADVYGPALRVLEASAPPMT